jgi:hypothetical protein
VRLASRLTRYPTILLILLTATHGDTRAEGCLDLNGGAAMNGRVDTSAKAEHILFGLSYRPTERT